MSNKNNKSILEFLPYTIDHLMLHLEKQFNPEMDWENYGQEWEIDHIIPDSHFNYESTENEEFQDCWALKNLRPLNVSENRKKGNKIL